MRIEDSRHFNSIGLNLILPANHAFVAHPDGSFDALWLVRRPVVCCNRL